jgi:hypothetical protein
MATPEYGWVSGNKPRLFPCGALAYAARASVRRSFRFNFVPRAAGTAIGTGTHYSGGVYRQLVRPPSRFWPWHDADASPF